MPVEERRYVYWVICRRENTWTRPLWSSYQSRPILTVISQGSDTILYQHCTNAKRICKSFVSIFDAMHHPFIDLLDCDTIGYHVYTVIIHEAPSSPSDIYSTDEHFALFWRGSAASWAIKTCINVWHILCYIDGTHSTYAHIVRMPLHHSLL